MKTKILILLSAIVLLNACKKSEVKPVEQPEQVQQSVNNPVVTPSNNSNTITIVFDPSTIGTIFVNWNYIETNLKKDSVYSTPNKIVLTKQVDSEIIRIRFNSSYCSSCSQDISNVTIYKNGTLLKLISDDFGNKFFYIKLN